LLGIDDPQVAGDLVAWLEQAGHQVEWVAALEVTPGPGRMTPDVLLVDGDAPGMDLAVVNAAWRRREPPPTLLVLGATAAARADADRVHARVLIKPLDPQQIAAELSRLSTGPRGDTGLTPTTALQVLGLVGGGLPEDEAALIVAGARKVDIALVREALRPHMFDYALATHLVDRLCVRRIFGPEEARLAVSLDGGRTVRGAIDGLPRADDDSTPVGALSAHQAARLLWALASSGAATLGREPAPHHPTGRLRAHVRARAARLGSATHYQVLELGLHATAEELERGFELAERRYGPAALRAVDLGDLAGVAGQVWEQIARARTVLGDARLRAEYDATLLARGADADAERARRRADADEAERTFLRGQHFLAGGDVFRAMSELAAAARRFPGQPDYEIYAAWTRLLVDETRGDDRRKLAERERPHAEKVLLGRRPWPRALYVAGLIAEAAGDPAAAAAHFGEALAADDKLAAARQALARVRGMTAAPG
jgi:hypothetical protein